MNKISITKITIDSSTIKVEFLPEGEITKYFSASHIFETKYSLDISNVPVSIAIIPFVCNILPIIWLTDTKFEIDEIDNNFFQSIQEFKKGYADMYPMFDFKGTISYKKLIDNSLNTEHKSQSSAAFFSGGVDAFATLIAHADERPSLITLWGSDISLDDYKGWEIVKNHAIETAQTFNVNADLVKTNFRLFINESELNKLVKDSKDNYWHGFQHGIGLIGHGAPIAWKRQLTTLYIASSYTEKSKGKVTCASDPTIDNYVKFINCHTVHDQYEYERQEKVEHICEFSNKNSLKINLRVCWITSGGHNCCKCEKCIRTMFEIFAVGDDPKNYGFNYTISDLKKSHNIVLDSYNLSMAPMWQEIKEKVCSLPLQSLPKEILWVKNLDFIQERKSVKFLLRRKFKSIKNLPKRIGNKIYRVIRK